MHRRNLYMLLFTLCFGLGLMVQPAHAAACLAQKMNPPGHPAGHSEHERHRHDGHDGHDDHGSSRNRNTHNCFCLQWRMGLGASCKETVKAVTTPSPVFPWSVGNGQGLIATIATPMDIAPEISPRHGGGAVLPLQGPIYLQIHSLLC